jgi:hypothetical protein
MDVYKLILPTNGDVRIALTTGTILGVVIGLHDLLQDILDPERIFLILDNRLDSYTVRITSQNLGAVTLLIDRSKCLVEGILIDSRDRYDLVAERAPEFGSSIIASIIQRNQGRMTECPMKTFTLLAFLSFVQFSSCFVNELDVLPSVLSIEGFSLPFIEICHCSFLLSVNESENSSIKIKNFTSKVPLSLESYSHLPINDIRNNFYFAIFNEACLHRSFR